MSGHSKWATIKHKKGAQDKARGKLFAKLIRQVEVAARAGGSDLDSNATLRTMYHKARDNSVPLDTIERAIKRGSGELEGVIYEAITYEAYAPNGVGLLIEVLTDNRNRIGPEIRTALKKTGGAIAEPGSVAWQFDRKGIVNVARAADEDEVMMAALDAGAEDITDEGDAWRVTCPPSEVNHVRDALEKAGIAVESADVTMLSQNTIALESVDAAKAVLRVVDAMDDLDDVQDVYGNFDIPDHLLDELEA